ncbi:MAG: SBBP repeat-containing protein, partial [Verrucomicrobiota bacterium]
MIRRAKIILGLAFGWAALAVSAQTAAPFPNLPLYFETNQAPSNHAFQFLARGRTSRFLVSPAEAQFALRRADGASPTVRMQFVGANQQAQISGDGELPGKINYLVGNNPEQWRTAVPAFTRVRVPDIYPGITLVYHGNQRQLEYDFTVAPEADPDAIRIHFEGVKKVVISPQGELVLALPDGEIRQAKPVVYQTVAGARSDVSGGYRSVDAHTVAFTVGRYDRHLPLVIDPVLSYATYFGGNYGDAAFSVKVDTNGFVYIAGETLSTQFPANIAPNDDQTNFNGGRFNGGQFTGDAFVAKFGNHGSNFVYLTYLGGSADDGALDVAVEGGHAFVTGFTDSTNFPVWPTNLNNHAFQTRIGGTNATFPLQTLGYNNDAFVTELSADGSALVYSSYLGGSGIDYGTAIAVDAAGDAYVTGLASSTNFPATNAFSPAYGPYCHFLQSSNYYLNGNAFITEVAAGGTNLLYSTYLGGTNYDSGEGIAVDANGNIYVSGVTDSTNFPVFPLTNALSAHLNGITNPLSQTFAFDGFVAKLAPPYTNLVYSTYLGSTNYDAASRIRCDNLGDAYVVGSTASTNFPNTVGTNLLIPSYVTNNINFFAVTTNVFVTELGPQGTNILNSVVFGGNLMDLGYDLALDTNNNIFVVGSTISTNFFTTNSNAGFLRATNSGNSDVFVTAFGANFSSVLYSTCLGGNNQDFGYGIAVDNMTNAYVVGQTMSTNFPAPNGLLTTLDGTNDAFLAVIQYGLQPVQIVSQPVGVTNGTGSSVSFSVGVTGTPPFFYQWQMTNATTLNTNGVLTWINLTNGGAISGATNATLTIFPATITNSGTYQVIVTNYALGGMVISTPALLSVTNFPVVITQQPVSQTNGVHGTVVFSVTNSGTPPFSYQWQINGAALTNGPTGRGSGIIGATNSSLTITNVQLADQANYTLVITNSVNSVTSSIATLTVFAVPTIVQQPVGETNGTGSPVLLTAEAFGTLPLHYHWQFQPTNQVVWTNLLNGGVISGVTTNQLLISSASVTNTGNYQLVVTNSVGSVTSSVALVVVTNFPIVITVQPVSQTNGVGATVSFTVTNSGTPPYFYHWQLNGANLVNGTTGSGSVISGATNSVLTLTGIHTNDMGNYSVIVSNSVNAATSSNATLTVYAFPTITQQPAGETVGAGATVTLAATAFGTLPLHYQWQVQATNQNTWANLANAGNISG